MTQDEHKHISTASYTESHNVPVSLQALLPSPRITPIIDTRHPVGKLLFLDLMLVIGKRTDGKMKLTSSVSTPPPPPPPRA